MLPLCVLLQSLVIFQETVACMYCPDLSGEDELAYTVGSFATSPHDRRFLITLKIGGRPVQGLLDTGCYPHGLSSVCGVAR